MIADFPHIVAFAGTRWQRWHREPPNSSVLAAGQPRWRGQAERSAL